MPNWMMQNRTHDAGLLAHRSRMPAHGCSEHSLQIALSVGMAKEIKGSNIHSRKIIAVFMGTIGLRNNDHGNFQIRTPYMPHEFPIRAILDPLNWNTLSPDSMLGRRPLAIWHMPWNRLWRSAVRTMRALVWLNVR